MGRYKSLLTSQIDARRFEHAVDIEVPGRGLGRQLDVMNDWCNSRCNNDQWANHGYMSLDHIHFTRFYFTYPNVADDFADEFDGARVDKEYSLWPRL